MVTVSPPLRTMARGLLLARRFSTAMALVHIPGHHITNGSSSFSRGFFVGFLSAFVSDFFTRVLDSGSGPSAAHRRSVKDLEAAKDRHGLSQKVDGLFGKYDKGATGMLGTEEIAALLMVRLQHLTSSNLHLILTWCLMGNEHRISLAAKRSAGLRSSL